MCRRGASANSWRCCRLDVIDPISSIVLKLVNVDEDDPGGSVGCADVCCFPVDECRQLGCDLQMLQVGNRPVDYSQISSRLAPWRWLLLYQGRLSGYGGKLRKKTSGVNFRIAKCISHGIVIRRGKIKF